uniref:IDP454 n=1 Tax=Arundo donax TaxID=35708 RepID=A0A0A8Y050_ARUDO
MIRGISACKHGASFKEIGQIISSLQLNYRRCHGIILPLKFFCHGFSEHTDKYGYGIDPFVGHGVGRIFHCEPVIWHTYNYEPGFMVAGQTFTIGTLLFVSMCDFAFQASLILLFQR